MNRRQFLKAVIAVPVAAAAAPLLQAALPRPWSVGPVRLRAMYGRITITPEMLALQAQHNSLTSAFVEMMGVECRGIVDDLNQPNRMAAFMRATR